MYKGKKVLGLVPARGGSKGLRGKNVRPLLGKPLIAWTIQQAGGSALLDAVIVSTNSAAIARVSRRYGAWVPFLRPKHLASDTSPVIDTILHLLDAPEIQSHNFDYVALLEPTSPLRKPGDIDAAIKSLIDNRGRADSLVSVGEIALEHPAYAKKIGADRLLHPYFDGMAGASLRQSLPSALFPYGVIYISSAPALRKFRVVYGGRIMPFPIERWQNYEINDICDFRCIEALLRHKKEVCKP
jgi:CMP-N-acetylneuraminic acid synthetase